MYVHDLISNQLYNYRVRKITYEGSSYREGDVVVMAKDDDNTPMFGVIRSIYYYHNEDKCFLTVTDMQADYHSHYHAYHVVTSSHTSITTPQALHTPHAFNTHTCFAEHLSHLKFVSLKFLHNNMIMISRALVDRVPCFAGNHTCPLSYKRCLLSMMYDLTHADLDRLYKCWSVYPTYMRDTF